jgi:hypothetical protein
MEITVKQLVQAVTSGALSRLLAIPKTIAAGYKNRKLPSACEEEIRLYEKARAGLVEKHGGTVPHPGALEYAFHDGGREAFERDMVELLSQPINLPGEPIKLTDLLSGGLVESDYAVLEPFLTGT